MWHDQPEDQNFWNMILTVLFIVLIAMSIMVLYMFDRLPLHISFFDFLLIAFATFRLTRLFVYDAVLQFMRDPFFAIHREGDRVMRTKPERGLRRTMADLLMCPWCIAMWAAGAVTFFYYLFMPFAWFPLLILGVSGAATFLQLLSNWIGWSAEDIKQHVSNHKADAHNEHNA